MDPLQFPPWGLGFVFVALVCLAGCGSTRDEQSVELARAGDAIVTAEEFRINYEFGYGHLRRATLPKEAILRYMLAEKVMAVEARNLRLDTLSSIRANRRAMEEELTIERVFTERVLKQLEVTEAEIREEVNRNAVRFQFRFVPAPDSVSALRVHQTYVAEGFEAAALLSVGQDAESVISEWTSPLLSATDIDPQMLGIIEDLPVATPSDPVRLGGLWYVFEVSDIRRTPVAEEDYEARAPSVQKVIWNRKAMEGATRFVANTMEPLDVTTRRPTLYALAEVMYEWYADRTPTRSIMEEISDPDRPAAQKAALTALLDDELVAFRGVTWTVEDFLDAFTPTRYVIRARDPASFTLRLADIVGLVVRDAVLLEMAKEEGFDDHPEDRSALRKWEEKWLFHALRDRSVDPDDVDWSRVAAVSDSLLARTEVIIHHAVLDTMTLAVSEVNPFMTVHLMKSHSNRMPFPIVDPNWNESHIKP